MSSRRSPLNRFGNLTSQDKDTPQTQDSQLSYKLKKTYRLQRRRKSVTLLGAFQRNHLLNGIQLEPGKRLMNKVKPFQLLMITLNTKLIQHSLQLCKLRMVVTLPVFDTRIS